MILLIADKNSRPFKKLFNIDNLVLVCNLISIEQKKEYANIKKELIYYIIDDFVGEMDTYIVSDRNDANMVLNFKNCKFFER